MSKLYCPKCNAEIVAIEETIAYGVTFEDGEIDCFQGETHRLDYFCASGCMGDIEELKEYKDHNINFN